jgi:hypothetical protein
MELYGSSGVLFQMSNEYPTERERLTPEERKAKEAERRLDAQKAMQELRLAEEAKYRNLERLRAERLAREAAAKKKEITSPQ